MDRDRIVDKCTDSVIVEELPKGIPLLTTHHILMIDMTDLRPARREAQAGDLQSAVVHRCQPPPAFIFLLQVMELDAEDSRLELVKAAIQSWKLAHISLFPTVLTQQLRTPCKFR